MSPPICATVVEATTEATLARMAVVAPSCGLIELRLDLAPDLDLARVVAARTRPLLVTCRPAREGGAWRGGEEERLALLARAAALGAEWVDLEWDAPRPDLPAATRIVVSRHALAPGGHDVEALLASLRAAPGHVQKLAIPVESAEQALALLERAAREPRPTLAVAMGEPGLVSRLAGTRWGAPWVYAAADGARPAAPGQRAADEVHALTRGRAFGPATRLLGVVGRPVRHSRSPLLMNAAFERLGVDAVFTTLDTGDPRALLARLSRDPAAAGLSVTMPHKRALAQALDPAALSPAARATGAVNTLVRSLEPGGGAWSGHNTDALAARELLAPHVARGAGPVLLLGAGGAARAVAFAARELGATVRVHARDAAQASSLARDLGCEAAGDLDAVPAARPGAIVVNATPLGMGDDARSPCDPRAFAPGVVAYDLVYVPEETPFLRAARAAGATAITGVEHFVRQARAQLALWLGEPTVAPLDLAWLAARARAG